MNGGSRQIVAHGMIVGAVLFGAHTVFIQPTKEELGATRRAIDSIRESAQDQSEMASRLPLVLQSVERADAGEAWLERVGIPARSESDLFDAVGRIASECGVRVSSMEPSDLQLDRVFQRRDRESAALQKQAEAMHEGVALRVAVMGTYAQIATFLDRYQSETGLCRVSKVRVSSLGLVDDPVVMCVVESEHHSFDLGKLASVVVDDEMMDDGGDGG